MRISDWSSDVCASEDFGCFGTAWQAPSVFWFVGGNDPEAYAKAMAAGKLHELPVNHSPRFAPILHPTLETGVEAMVVGALAWLGASRSEEHTSELQSLMRISYAVF